MSDTGNSLMIAIAVVSIVTALLAIALRVRFSAMRTSDTESDAALVEQINLLLPQTQCGRCTFSGCKPYGAAVAHGAADTDQCPPGGDRTAYALAHLLGRPAKPVNPKFGVVHTIPRVAWIDEPACIGCTKCIQACPVDAIVGASKFMHTVIASHCTGCELCIPPCPVDCIEMHPLDASGRQLQTLTA